MIEAPTKLSVVPIAAHDRADIAKGLRLLAEQIERGEYGEALNLAWAIDTGGDRPPSTARIECGLLGKSPEAGGCAHLLFCCAARRMENAALEYGVLEATDA